MIVFQGLRTISDDFSSVYNILYKCPTILKAPAGNSAITNIHVPEVVSHHLRDN